MSAASRHDDSAGSRRVDRRGALASSLWWHRAGASRRRDVVLRALGCALLVSCNSYDPGLLPPPPGASGSGGGGTGGMDASTEDGGGDGGVQDGGGDACISSAVETCNRIDDDCDGRTDEGAELVCVQTILNAVADCVPYANTARCVLVACLDGYDRCDGNPANGCEPYCDCNECDDAGTEDAGE